MLERDHIGSGRSAALGENGMAATSHPLATLATDPIGGRQTISIDHPRGILIGGTGHRKDGLALGH
jgi:hypothetical protein